LWIAARSLAQDKVVYTYTDKERCDAGFETLRHGGGDSDHAFAAVPVVGLRWGKRPKSSLKRVSCFIARPQILGPQQDVLA
jgi:hypothetical protein